MFFIGMFFCNLLMPLVMLVGGYLMYKKPPKDINGIFGYRTKRSTRNIETWFFAHNYCGRLWMKLGVIVLVPTIVAQLPFVKASDNVIGLVTTIIETLQLACILGSIVLVERALKGTFDENGRRY